MAAFAESFRVRKPTELLSADDKKLIHENALEPQIKKDLFGLDVNDSKQLAERAANIRQRILEAPVPKHIADEIAAAYRQLGEGPVAVRSSATAEDLPEASFAGQQSTYLNVVGADNVVRAVQACWASLYEGRAVFYREESGYDHLKVGLAVPVQRMVQSEKSGVMFTVEPVSSDPTKITIEAVFGLGEGIVSGEISPDLYLVEKESLRIVRKEHQHQGRMIARTDVRGGKVTGCKLQRWRHGRNETRHVPAPLVETVRQGTQGYAQFMKLAQAYVDVREQDVLRREDGSKKKSTKP